MLKIILELVIIVAAIVELIASIKTRKSNGKSKFWDVVILITSLILSCCWFTKGLAFKAGPEALSYVLAMMQALIACGEAEYLRHINHIYDKVFETTNTADEYIDIGTWEENDKEKTETQTQFIDMK